MAKETIGEYLRRERELRQISLEEMVQGTKIALQRLKELENDKLEDMPAEIFVRGFIKSYAEFIGLNPDEVLLRYEEELKALQEKEAAEAGTVYHFDDVSPQSNLAGIIVVAIIVFAIAAAGYWFFLKSGIKLPDFFTKKGESSPVIMISPGKNSSERQFKIHDSTVSPTGNGDGFTPHAGSVNHHSEVTSYGGSDVSRSPAAGDVH